MEQAAPEPQVSAGDSQGLHLAELAAGPFVPIAESMPAMLWIGDPEGKCVYLNKALREFWGVAPADLPRFTWASTLLEEDAPRLFETFRMAMAAKQAFNVTARYRRADGEIRVLQTLAEPRFAPNGEFMGMVGVNIDIGGGEDRAPSANSRSLEAGPGPDVKGSGAAMKRMRRSLMRCGIMPDTALLPDRSRGSRTAMCGPCMPCGCS